MINTPIYRAKKIDSNEYVIGWLANPTPSLFYIFFNRCGYLNINNEVCVQEDERAEIDPSTLSIHFPDMLDSDGNKIFASLSEDGKGGDICNLRNSPMHSFVDEGTACYYDGCFVVRPNKGFVGNYVNLEIVGIQQ